MAVRRLLLTGAGGFVGGHMLAVLAARLPATEVIATRFDLTGAAAARPDACIHLTAVDAAVDAREKGYGNALVK